MSSTLLEMKRPKSLFTELGLKLRRGRNVLLQVTKVQSLLNQ